MYDCSGERKLPDKNPSPIIWPVPSIQMQYSNFEENPEVRLPSDVCGSVREEISSRAAHLTRYNSEFGGSVSSTQNPQSPTHSDGTRASTKSTSLPHSAETGIMAHIALHLETSWVKMTVKCVIHQDTYKCNFLPMDNKLTGFIFNTTVNDHECK
jgi:hypothetical protein